MTEVQERAIAKIDAEIEKEKGNRILEIIGEFLINLVTANPDAAEKLLDEKKNLKGAYEAMRNEARKYQKDGCAVLTDDEGFEVICGYYGLEYHSGGKIVPEKAPDVKAATALDIELDDLLK